MSRSVSIAFLFLAALACLAQADLNWSRTHLVESTPQDKPNAFFFRSNQPNNATHFQYDTLMEYMRRSAAESRVNLPDKLYVIDISIATPLEKGYKEEAEFWKNNPSKGEFISWPLGLAGIMRPSFYSDEERREMINNTVWQIDQIPERIEWVQNRLRDPSNARTPIAIVVHCAAGCDRTGEFIGSYRMRYQSADAEKMYALNTEECGRSPNWWGTTALEWYCWTHRYHTGRDPGDCDNFAECELFGHCQPKKL